MNEAQVRTADQVRQVLAGTQELRFRAARDDQGRYAWIKAVLRRLGYCQLGRADNAPELQAGDPRLVRPGSGSTLRTAPAC